MHISYPHVISQSITIFNILFSILTDIKNHFKFVLFHKLTGQHAIEEIIDKYPQIAVE